MQFVTECMLRATSIGVCNVVVDMNITSFNLMWTTNMAYNSSYFITLSANSENVMSISTNESFVTLILQINVLYYIDINYELNKMRRYLDTFQILWFKHNLLIQGNISGSKNKSLTITCASITNCSNSSINLVSTTHSSSKLFHYYSMKSIK